MIEEKVLIQRLNKVYKQHTPEDYTYGTEFYSKANQDCTNLALQYNITIQQAVGIFSCLSPRLRYEFNYRAAEWFLQGRRNVHVGTQIKKCEEILKTTDEKEIVKIINGEKTISFYNNIYNYIDKSYVTIDRWILRICYDEDKISVTDKNYQIFKNACIKAAKSKKLLPLQYQAIIWRVIRNQNNSRLDKQKNDTSNNIKSSRK